MTETECSARCGGHHIEVQGTDSIGQSFDTRKYIRHPCISRHHPHWATMNHKFYSRPLFECTPADSSQCSTCKCCERGFGLRICYACNKEAGDLLKRDAELSGKTVGVSACTLVHRRQQLAELAGDGESLFADPARLAEISGLDCGTTDTFRCGHPRTKENSHRTRDPQVSTCRQCNAEASRAGRLAKRAAAATPEA